MPREAGRPVAGDAALEEGLGEPGPGVVAHHQGRLGAVRGEVALEEEAVVLAVEAAALAEVQGQLAVEVVAQEPLDEAGEEAVE